MATQVALTDAKIRSPSAPASMEAEIIGRTIPDLRFRTGISGAKSFVLRKQVPTKTATSLFADVRSGLTLADARKKVRALLSDLEVKADPIKALLQPKKRAPAGYTIRALGPESKKAKADRPSIREIERVFDRHIVPKRFVGRT